MQFWRLAKTHFRPSIAGAGSVSQGYDPTQFAHQRKAKLEIGETNDPFRLALTYAKRRPPVSDSYVARFITNDGERGHQYDSSEALKGPTAWLFELIDSDFLSRLRGVGDSSTAPICAGLRARHAALAPQNIGRGLAARGTTCLSLECNRKRRFSIGA